jgi:hypothetical protein
MASLPIPSPPPTPNGDRWVENWRGVDEVQYFSEDGWASISLQLVSDKDGRRWEWRSHEVIVGLDQRALAEEWEQARADGLDRVFERPPVAAPAPVAGPVSDEHMGREERPRLYEERETEPEPDPMSVPDVALEPAPGSLYDGVPEEERRAFTRWLMG